MEKILPDLIPHGTENDTSENKYGKNHNLGKNVAIIGVGPVGTNPYTIGILSHQGAIIRTPDHLNITTEALLQNSENTEKEIDQTLRLETDKNLFQELLEQIGNDIIQRLNQTKKDLLENIVQQEKYNQHHPHPRNTKLDNIQNNKHISSRGSGFLKTHTISKRNKGK